MKEIKKLNKDNDEGCQSVLFKRYYQKIYNTAYAVIRDPHLVQDIVQETFLKIFQQKDHLKEIDHMDSWIKRITYRTAIDCLRKKKKWESFTMEEDYIDTIGQDNSGSVNISPVEDEAESQMMKKMIHEAVLKLNPVERIILLFKYEYQLKDEEIASILGISIGTVKSKYFRIKQKLSKALENSMDIEEVVEE